MSNEADFKKTYRSSATLSLELGKTRGKRSEAAAAARDGQGKESDSGKKARKEKSAPPLAPPEFVVKPRRQFINSGEVAKFKASFDGGSETKLFWSKDGKVLCEDVRHKIYENEGYHFLEIKDVTSDDNGQYSCTIQNSAGSDVAAAELEVFEKPKLLSREAPAEPTWETPLSDIIVQEGDLGVELTCVTKDLKAPNATWYHNGREIFSGFHMKLHHVGQSTTLILKEVKEKDGGHFKCVMKGGNGKLESECTMTVLPAEKLEPPVFVRELHDMEVEDGDKLELVVEVKGTPPIDVFWFHNNVEITPDSPHFLLASIGHVHTLTLPRATADCSGEFVCEAYNECGDTDTFCLIDVQEVECPEAPSFLTYPPNLITYENEAVTFSCKVTGQPSPGVMWERDGVVISPSQKFKTTRIGDQHSLTIFDPELADAGEYICHLHNCVGDLSHTFVLEVLAGSQEGATGSAPAPALRSRLQHRRERGMKEQTLRGRSNSPADTELSERLRARRAQLNDNKALSSPSLSILSSATKSTNGSALSSPRDSETRHRKLSSKHDAVTQTQLESSRRMSRDTEPQKSEAGGENQTVTDFRSVLKHHVEPPSQTTSLSSRGLETMQAASNFTIKTDKDNPSTVEFRIGLKPVHALEKPGLPINSQKADTKDEALTDFRSVLKHRTESPEKIKPAVEDTNTSTTVDFREVLSKNKWKDKDKDIGDSFKSELVDSELRNLQIARSSRNVLSRGADRFGNNGLGVGNLPSSSSHENGSQTHREFLYKRSGATVNKLGLRSVNKSLDALKDSERSKSPPLSAREDRGRNREYSPCSSYQTSTLNQQPAKPFTIEQSKLTVDNTASEPRAPSPPKSSTENVSSLTIIQAKVSQNDNEKVPQIATESSSAPAPSPLTTSPQIHITSIVKRAQQREREASPSGESLTNDSVHNEAQHEHFATQSFVKDSAGSISVFYSDNSNTHSSSSETSKWPLLDNRISPSAKPGLDSEATSPSHISADNNDVFVSETDQVKSSFSHSSSIDRSESTTVEESRTVSKDSIKSPGPKKVPEKLLRFVSDETGTSESSSNQWKSTYETKLIGERPKSAGLLQRHSPPWSKSEKKSTTARASTSSDSQDDFRKVKLRKSPRSELEKSKFMSKSTESIFTDIKLKPVSKETTQKQSEISKNPTAIKAKSKSSTTIFSKELKVRDIPLDTGSSANKPKPKATGLSKVPNKDAKPFGSSAKSKFAEKFDSPNSSKTIGSPGVSRFARKPLSTNVKTPPKASGQSKVAEKPEALKVELKPTKLAKPPLPKSFATSANGKDKVNAKSNLDMPISTSKKQANPKEIAARLEEKSRGNAKPIDERPTRFGGGNNNAKESKFHPNATAKSENKKPSGFMEKLRQWKNEDIQIGKGRPRKLSDIGKSHSNSSLEGEKSSRFDSIPDWIKEKAFQRGSIQLDRLQGFSPLNSKLSRSLPLVDTDSKNNSEIGKLSLSKTLPVNFSIGNTTDDKEDLLSSQKNGHVPTGFPETKRESIENEDSLSGKLNFSSLRSTVRTDFTSPQPKPSSEDDKLEWVNRKSPRNIEEQIKANALNKTTTEDSKPEWVKIKSPRDIRPHNRIEGDIFIYESKYLSRARVSISNDESPSIVHSEKDTASKQVDSEDAKEVELSGNNANTKMSEASWQMNRVQDDQTAEKEEGEEDEEEEDEEEEEEEEKVTPVNLKSESSLVLSTDESKTPTEPSCGSNDTIVGLHQQQEKSQEVDHSFKPSTSAQSEIAHDQESSSVPSFKKPTIARPPWMKSKSMRNIPIYPIHDNELSPRYEPFRSMDDAESTISTTSLSSSSSEASNITNDSGYVRAGRFLDFEKDLQSSTKPISTLAQITSATQTVESKGKNDFDKSDENLATDDKEPYHDITKESNKEIEKNIVSEVEAKSTMPNGLGTVETVSTSVERRGSKGKLEGRRGSQQANEKLGPTKAQTSVFSKRYGQNEDAKQTTEDANASSTNFSSKLERDFTDKSSASKEETSTAIQQTDSNTLSSLKSKFETGNNITSAKTDRKDRLDTEIGRSNDVLASKPAAKEEKESCIKSILSKFETSASTNVNEKSEPKKVKEEKDEQAKPSTTADDRRAHWRSNLDERLSSLNLGSKPQPSGDGSATERPVAKRPTDLDISTNWRSSRSRLKVTSGVTDSEQKKEREQQNRSGKMSSIDSGVGEASDLSPTSSINTSSSTTSLFTLATVAPETTSTSTGTKSGPSAITNAVIEEKEKITSCAPSFSVPLSDVKVMYGSGATLRCQVTGYPTPTVKWLLNQTQVEESPKVVIQYKDGQAELTLKETFNEHVGVYTCVATNSEGELSTQCAVALDVSDKEESRAFEGPVSLPPKVVSLTPKAVSLLRGSTLNVTATFIGEPVPVVKWIKNGQLLKSDGRRRIMTEGQTSLLTIESCDHSDSGQVSVSVSSSLGSNAMTMDICIEDVPGAPLGKPHIYDITACSASVSWCGPPSTGSDEVVYYVVEAKTRQQKSWDVVVPQCKEMCCHIHNLKPVTTYQFRVRAANKHGLGAPSDPSEKVITTDPFRSPISDVSDGYAEVFTPTVEYRGLDELPFEPKDVQIKTQDKFEDHYEVIKEVGKGKFGTVYKCKQKASGTIWAAKIVKCRESDKHAIRQEIEVMNLLRHPKLLMLWDAFDSPRKMVLVMEFVGAGELFERVIGEDFVLTERDCVHFLRQICEGVAYMHNSSVLHLDLKPENILCVHENSNRIKIIDFGLARRFKKGESLKVMFGTPEFIAPEVINYDEIDFGTDMWSVGVICYVLLSGLSPFLGDNDAETLANVTSGEFDFDDDAFDEISDQAKDFISKLLIKRKEKRLSTQQCLAHDWLNQDEVDGMRYKRLNTERLRRFMVRRKWLKTGNAVLAVSRLLKNSMSAFSRSNSRDSDLDGSMTPDTPESPGTTQNPPFKNNAVKEHDQNNSSNVIQESNDVSGSGRSQETDNSELFTSAKTMDTLSNGRTFGDDSSSSSVELSNKLDSDNSVSSVDRNANPVDLNQNDIETNDAENFDPPSNNNAAKTASGNLQNDANNSSGSGDSPLFFKPMKDSEAFAGDVVRFDVTVSGNPAPEVSWYFEEEKIEPDSTHVLENNVQKGTYSLIIRSISESNEGEYSCKAVNSCGEKVCSAELSVLEL